MFAKKTCALVLSVAAVFGFVPQFAGAATNLIYNGALETGSSFPSGWSRMYWGPVVPTFAYPVSGRSGKAVSVSLPRDTSGDGRWQPTPFTIEAGAQYTYSGWYVSNAATKVNAEYQDARGARSYAGFLVLPSSGGAWREARVTFTVPAGVTKATIYHSIEKQGSLTIDDVSLTKNETTPPPPPPPSGGWSEGMVTLSFDDAWASQYAQALPVLAQHGLKGTFYILTQPVQNGWSGYMTPAQVIDVASKGHDMQGHTVTHRNLTGLSQSAIDAEIKNSKTYIEGLTGRTVTSLAYPYGSSNAKVIERAKLAGYTNGRAADPTIPFGFNTQTTSRFTINSFSPNSAVSVAQIKAAIDKAKAEKTWFVLSMHEIKVNGDQYSMTPAAFAEVVNHIKASGIKVVTMSEGAALLQ